MTGDDLFQKRGAGPGQSDDEDRAFIDLRCPVDASHSIQCGPLDDAIRLGSVGFRIKHAPDQTIADGGSLEGGIMITKSIACPGQSEGRSGADLGRDPTIGEDRFVSFAGAGLITVGSIDFGDQPLSAQGPAFELDEVPDRCPRLLDSAESAQASNSKKQRDRGGSGVDLGGDTLERGQGIFELTGNVTELRSIRQIGDRGHRCSVECQVEPSNRLDRIVLYGSDSTGQPMCRFWNRMVPVEIIDGIQCDLDVAMAQGVFPGFEGH